MKKLIVISTFILSIMISLHAQVATPPPEVLKAAQEGFVPYLNNAVDEETKTIVGFDADDNLGKAVLGEPFQLYSLPANSIKNFDELSSIKSSVIETGMWYFPIKIDDVIKMVLYVGKKGDTWTRAGLGSANLAKQMQKIVTQFPSKDGYTPMLIKQYDIGGYLYSIPQLAEQNLTETRAVLSTSPGLKPLKEALDNLKNRIKK